MLKRWKIMLKHDFCEKLRIFSEELKLFGEFAATGFVWHFADNDLLMNVLPEQAQHNHPYCRRIKGNPYRKLDQCIQFHHFESFRKLELNPDSGSRRCHAGCRILAVGMVVSCRLAGVLFAGPFAGDRTNPLSRELPILSDARLENLGIYLKQRMDNLFNREHLPLVERRFCRRLSRRTADSLGGALHEKPLQRSVVRVGDSECLRIEYVALSSPFPPGDRIFVQ